MKRISAISKAASFLAAASLFIVSCQEKTQPETVFSLGSDTVEADAAGGVVKVTYTLENPVDGVSIDASYEADWISAFSADTPGEISFTVAENAEETTREAVVTVRYGDIAEDSFKLVQAGTVPASDPVITVSEDKVSAGAEGGSLSVGYTVANPVDGTSVEAECAQTWVNGFDVSEEGVIKFNVDANDDVEVRTATVTVKYGQSEDTFTVEQEGRVIDLSFEITVDEVTATSVVFDVVPSDKTVTYVYMGVEKSLFDEFADDEAYFQDDLDYFEYLADAFGMPLEDFLKEYMLFTGDQLDQEITSLDPETEYYIYAYGLTASAKRTSDIYKVPFTTQAEGGSGTDKPLEIVYDKYFYVDDALIEMYPDDSEIKANKGKCMVPVEFLSNDESLTIYSTYYMMDWSASPESDIIDAINSDISGGYATEGNYVRFFLTEGGSYSILAMGKDGQGNAVAPQAVYLGTLSKDNAAPADSYVPKSSAPAAPGIVRLRTAR